MRSVSRGSSAIMVPTPTMMASLACRNSCTCARASSLVIQPPLAVNDPIAPGVAPSPGGGAILPSSVIAVFRVTNGDLRADIFRERLVQLLSFRLPNAFLHLDSGIAQAGQPSSRHCRIRIAHGYHDAFHARGDNGIGAWAGASHVGARFEIHIEGGAASAISGCFQRQNLGMFSAFVGVRTATDDFALGIDKHRAHARDWERPGPRLCRRVPALAA